MHRESADEGQQTRKVLRDCNAHLAVLIGGMDGLGQQAGRRNGAGGQVRSEEAIGSESGGTDSEAGTRGGLGGEGLGVGRLVRGVAARR